MNIGIIGGGASGMFLASMIKKTKNTNITLIERNSKLGKKLLLTGNGKCNFTNDSFGSNEDNIYNNEFAYNIYKSHDKDEFLSFMRDIGIEPKIEIHKGYKYYYPNSNKSTSVYYALLDKIVANDIDILYDTFVKDIRINNGRFNVILNDDQLTFDKVVIATGGNTYKNTGSDGNIYKILERLGHKIIKPLPALCGFTYEDKELLGLKGVRVDAKVCAKVWSSDKNDIEKEFIECGEIQFTQNGISGIPIMNLSRLVNRCIDDGRRVDLSIDLSPTTKNNDLLNLTEYLNDRKEKIYYKKARDFLCGYIPDEIADIIIKRCGIIDKSVSNLNTSDIVKMAKLILGFEIENIKIPSIDNAQITIGGVDTNEVDGASLESTIIKNMYIIGEALDVDGKCGGYNLQFAYSSAATVAKKLKE